jgi:uncharacterized membrane protein
MFWLWLEISVIWQFAGNVTLVWTLYTIIIYLIGIQYEKVFFARIAMATLLVIVAKLFFQDLARLETIWRILICFGLGTFLLAISYFVSSYFFHKDTPER